MGWGTRYVTGPTTIRLLLLFLTFVQVFGIVGLARDQNRLAGAGMVAAYLVAAAVLLLTWRVFSQKFKKYDIVTVDCQPLGASTSELTITHELGASRDAHFHEEPARKGWTAMLQTIERELFPRRVGVQL